MNLNTQGSSTNKWTCSKRSNDLISNNTYSWSYSAWLFSSLESHSSQYSSPKFLDTSQLTLHTQTLSYILHQAHHLLSSQEILHLKTTKTIIGSRKRKQKIESYQNIETKLTEASVLPARLTSFLLFNNSNAVFIETTQDFL